MLYHNIIQNNKAFYLYHAIKIKCDLVCQLCDYTNPLSLLICVKTTCLYDNIFLCFTS